MISESDRIELEESTRAYVNGLENLADFWGLIVRKKYDHRVKNYDFHDGSIDLIPRNFFKGSILSLETLKASCLVPYEMA